MALSIFLKRDSAAAATSRASPANLLKNKFDLHLQPIIRPMVSTSLYYHCSSSSDDDDYAYEDDHRIITSPAKKHFSLAISEGDKMKSIGVAGMKKKKRIVMWDAKQDEEAMHIMVELPGVCKENLKVSVDDNNHLNIKGETDKYDINFDESVKEFNGNKLPPNNDFKFDQVKAVMKNGILRISVPKLQEEENKVKDMFQLKVE